MKKKPRHESGFLEAPLVRQADGELKNKELLRKVPSIYGSNLIMERNKTFSGLLIIPNIITKKWGLYLQTLGRGGHCPTGPSASSPPKVKMISEYKRILWQATSSLIIDLSSFLYSGISDRNSVCY